MHTEFVQRGEILRPAFFHKVVHDQTVDPKLSGLCAGFELKRWRVDALADFLTEYLPEFCLSYSEVEALRADSAVELFRRAAKRVYDSGKFAQRGEFGELLLHAIIRETSDTLPAISKLFYKDAANDTVKGFDAVHVVVRDANLELWLGEVKFYSDITKAIHDVRAELLRHSTADYLRAEFVAITNKIDNSWPHAERLKRLLDPRVSLDTVFDSLCVPVLLTYDGDAILRHSEHSDAYFQEAMEEFRGIHERFSKPGLPQLSIHLFLVPMRTKADLVQALDVRLKAWQRI